MENLLAGETVPGLDSDPPTRFPYGSQTASVPQVWLRTWPACGCCVDVRMSQLPFSRQRQAHVHAGCRARSCIKSFTNLRH